MHRKIAAAVAALALFAGPSTVSFAQNPLQRNTARDKPDHGKLRAAAGRSVSTVVGANVRCSV